MSIIKEVAGCVQTVVGGNKFLVQFEDRKNIDMVYFPLCMYVMKRRLTTRWMILFITYQMNRLNCWLIMVILLVKWNACLNKVFICMFCIVYAFLMIYQWICWRISQGKRDISTLSRRRNSFSYYIEKKWKYGIVKNN